MELQDIGFIGESMDLMTHALGVWALRGSLHAVPGLTPSSDVNMVSINAREYTIAIHKPTIWTLFVAFFMIFFFGGASSQSVVPYRVCQQTQSSSSQCMKMNLTHLLEWNFVPQNGPPFWEKLFDGFLMFDASWCFPVSFLGVQWPFVSWGLGMVTCGIFFILSSNNSNKDTSMKDEWFTSHFSLFFSISQNDTLKLQRINKGVAELCRGDFSRRPCEIVDLELLQWNLIG